MLSCSCKNCFFEFTDYKYINKNDYHKFNKRKGGILIVDKYDRLLLVQSRGHLFGIAKGTLENYESFENGAIRELKEETGIDIDASQLKHKIQLNQSCYYYVKLDDEIYPKVQKHIVDNDANSVVLISFNCLLENIENKKMKLTHQTKKVLGKLYEIDFFKL